MVDDRRFMDRALELARSVAFTSPNPRVGAVVVRGSEIIGEGAHQGASRPHAETVALDGIDARGATLFVTLEPCVHQGRTPPCAPAVVAAGVERVVIAMTDPDKRASGRGVAHLRSHGIDVSVGLLEREARRLNAAFVHQRSTGRPLLLLKLALTLDGRLGAPDGSSRWITGPEARAVVHRRRTEVDAVLVGAQTVVTDDPSLTARGVESPRQPARVIVDARGIVAPENKVFESTARVIVATSSHCPHDLQTEYKERGAEVVVLDSSAEGIDLRALLVHLGDQGWLEVMCEGGGLLASSCLRAGLADRLELHYGPVLVGAGGPQLGDLGIGTLEQAQRWVTTAVTQIGDGAYVELDSPDLAALLEPVAETGRR